MNTIRTMKRTSVFLTLAILLLLVTGVQADANPDIAREASASYEITWWTVDGGGGNSRAGGTSAGGAYTVAGTIGQPDAGEMENGDYSLTGGFWAAVAEYLSYLPLVLKD
jgi:hypothetical protein